MDSHGLRAFPQGVLLARNDWHVAVRPSVAPKCHTVAEEVIRFMEPAAARTDRPPPRAASVVAAERWRNTEEITGKSEWTYRDLGLPCKVPMGTPSARRQLLPDEKASGRHCERKHVPVKKHADWRLWATLESPPVRRDRSDLPRNVPRRSSEHGWRAWRRRSGVPIAQRCTTACTARASVVG